MLLRFYEAIAATGCMLRSAFDAMLLKFYEVISGGLHVGIKI